PASRIICTCTSFPVGRAIATSCPWLATLVYYLRLSRPPTIGWPTSASTEATKASRRLRWGPRRGNRVFHGLNQVVNIKWFRQNAGYLRCSIQLSGVGRDDDHRNVS